MLYVCGCNRGSNIDQLKRACSVVYVEVCIHSRVVFGYQSGTKGTRIPKYPGTKHGCYGQARVCTRVSPQYVCTIHWQKHACWYVRPLQSRFCDFTQKARHKYLLNPTYNSIKSTAVVVENTREVRGFCAESRASSVYDQT